MYMHEALALGLKAFALRDKVVYVEVVAKERDRASFVGSLNRFASVWCFLCGPC